MKNLIFSLVLFLVSFFAGASTSITTSTVSGHWTLAGSPYYIFNDVFIPGSDTLTIDPGVTVSFMGAYCLNVNGYLMATGTSLLPINFTINDTTGFTTDTLTAAGGWYGINYSSLSGPYVSILQYCNVSYIKIDDTAWARGYYAGLNSMRSISLLNCNFFQNRTIRGGTYIVHLDAYSPNYNEIGYCNFYNNSSYEDLIIFDNYYGGSTHFHDCSIYNNPRFICAVTSSISNLLFEYNDVYGNSGMFGTIEINDGHNTIFSNKVHDNINQFSGAFYCAGGFTDFNSNLICNNQHTLGACPDVDGGGGININGITGISEDSTYFTIRNNVIANNFSPFQGGAIHIYMVRASIVNNQIVNNSSNNGGAIFMANDLPVIIKNNIFYGNVSLPYTAAQSGTVVGLSTDSIFYEHNWQEQSSYVDAYGLLFGPAVTGDTSTNIRGNDPGLIAPTLTSSVSESALTANFGISITSPCINTGDSAHASAAPYDYAGNSRIIGHIIDIGAYEFTSICADSITGPVAICSGATAAYVYSGSGGFWCSPESPATISVDSLSGSVTAVDHGWASLRYIQGGTCVATLNVHVDTLSGPIIGPAQTCAGLNMLLGDIAPGGAWTASNSCASITDGLVTGVAPGMDTITYSISNSCGTGVQTKTISILPELTAGVITGPATVCIGSSILLSDTAIGGTWSASNSFAAISAGVVTGLSLGTDTIGYSVDNTCGSVYVTTTVNVLPHFPSAGVILGLSDVCEGASITLTDTTSGGVWSATNGYAVISLGDVAAVTVGIDTMQYSVTNACGTAVSSHVITVLPLPDAGTVTGSSSVCVGDRITLTDPALGGGWSSANSSGLMSSNILIGIAAGLDTVEYLVSNSCGTAVATQTVAVLAFPAPGAISGNSSVCTGSSTSLTESVPGGVWSVSNSAASVSDGVVNGISASVDSVIYTVTNSCGSATAIHPFTVYASPNAGTITGKQNLCPGDQYKFTDNIAGGVWGTSNHSIAGVTTGWVDPLTPGTDTIFYSVANAQCTSKATYVITVLSLTECANGVATIQQTGNMSVFPNPASNNFSVSVPVTGGIIQIQDIEGRVIMESKAENQVTSFDVQNIAKGFYFASWTDVSGSKQVMKFVIE